MVHSDAAKWQLPGWRIEQRYSTKCLIGNWEEDRRGKVCCFVNSLEVIILTSYDANEYIHHNVKRSLIFQFVKTKEVATSSNRHDYKPYGPDAKPDTAIRRNALSKSEVRLHCILASFNQKQEKIAGMITGIYRRY